jgi:prepilin-type N-terminal cleavage/methylation domain-containing protein/prepilin-type processing-associated H-X9-DG protein
VTRTSHMGSALRTAPRRKAFTLIELLVVIAIIGILAAMLFPVFARARESARKTQCLANVKNIAIAWNIYLTDYDRFGPGEHRPEVVAAFASTCGCDPPRDACPSRVRNANPYLRGPVILDEYVKSRDIWRCPSSRFVQSFHILGNESQDCNGDWFRGWSAHIGECPGPRTGDLNFPPGWGGTATDFIAQRCDGRTDRATGAFQMTLGTDARWMVDASTSIMDDPTKYPVVYDAGNEIIGADRTSWIAYPDSCRLDGVAACGCGGDWANCSWSRDCSVDKLEPRFATDVQYRKEHAPTRHMGGSNIGFADGHAKWFSSETILWSGENWSGWGNDSDLIRGFGVCTVPILNGSPK